MAASCIPPCMPPAPPHLVTRKDVGLEPAGGREAGEGCEPGAWGGGARETVTRGSGPGRAAHRPVQAHTEGRCGEEGADPSCVDAGYWESKSLGSRHGDR